ncbi:MAG: hypothetical protein CVV64_05260 [Candidatus Wallbacteria bacterium HGW-Wallbacteria-1]|jgi:hypothetical protein|uniref:Uncharacterized protein n=1 Tax=Candidatus Wallbacteria bacterium HGW-Wallbacteria-1 TaxID=2013854 RepID=A0A2N1PS63_9BACT|nr:MAG: hypothetical protein CVV64_05260 [Candidatus Wallbacteria bacterium HGW-Wallbacteria-1]
MFELKRQTHGFRCFLFLLSFGIALFISTIFSKISAAVTYIVSRDIVSENASHGGESPLSASVFRQESFSGKFFVEDADTILFRTENDDGADIYPGTAMVFDIPLEFRGRILSHGMVRFRKRSERAPEKGWDSNNAYISFWVHLPGDQKSPGGSWRIWKDQFGSEKRASAGSALKPKKNTFFNCLQLIGDSGSDRVAISCRGEGDRNLSIATFHELRLVFLGESDSVKPDLRVIRTFSSCGKVNGSTLQYLVNRAEGLSLRHGESLDFEIPEKFQNQHLQYAILTHRKDPSLAVDPGNPDVWDPNPSYVLFEAHDHKRGFWHRWVDRNGSAKFSEIRDAAMPEDEILHNCMKALGTLFFDRVRLTNVGFGDVKKSIASIHELQLVFRPDLSDAHVHQRIYTSETVFPEPGNGRPVPLFGGGPRLAGKFPGALALGVRSYSRISEIIALPEMYGFTVSADPGSGNRIDTLRRLHIKLPVGSEFLYFEMALGDLDSTCLTWNKDGYFGRSGSAEVNIYLRNPRQPGRDCLLLANANVGMACLLAVSPPDGTVMTEEGDEIVIEAVRDVVFLMGYRIYTKDNSN